ncbi:hypothetical protein SFC43_06435 [Bacteroides sp. CR5/BHMF/2]|nr:hypothetical protein [Bacteroides sp. CR5/BHMF/2]
MFKLVGIWVQVPGGLNMLNYLYSKKKNVGLKFRVVLLIKVYYYWNQWWSQAVKVIVPQGSTWIIESSYQFSDITEIVVENGGKVEIAKNASLVLTNKSYLTVMPGGSIIGEELFKLQMVLVD